jgi:S-adenosyl-L-methionine hydrolase (adenosine-forming)
MKDGDRAPAIFFLSDYGTVDEFVGVVHAVLHRSAPSLRVIDLSHQIPPFAIDLGAAMLVRCAPSLGPGVVLAVVDPGVGTARRGVAIAVRGDGPTWLVGPDNGLLLPMAHSLGGVDGAVALDPAPFGPTGRGRPHAGHTFDGRDLFAPAAAHLARGGDPETVGTRVDARSLVTLASEPDDGGEQSAPRPAESTVVTTATWIDHFGNVQLRLLPEVLEELGIPIGGVARVTMEPQASGDTPVRRVVAFAQLAEGEAGLMVDANGQLALVANRASAAIQLGVSGPGQRVRISA